MSKITLSEIWIHPVKSLRGLRVEAATLTPRGLAHDRRWMVVDDTGRFLTQRQLPHMALIHPRIEHETLILEDRGGNAGLPLTLPLVLDTGTPVEVEVWGDRCRALDAGDAVADWLGRALNRPVRLVYQPDDSHRPVDPNYARPGDETAFNDGFPVLIVSQASLDELNRRLGRALPMRRFRPNLVVSGDLAPHAEDGWRRIRIGDAELELVKPCSRCIVTTVDPETAERDPEREPLRTLMAYRQQDNKVYFGQNAIPRRLADLRTGQPVTVLETGAARPSFSSGSS